MAQPAKLYPVLWKELAVSAVSLSVVICWVLVAVEPWKLERKVTVLLLALQIAYRLTNAELGVGRAAVGWKLATPHAAPTLGIVAHQPPNEYPVGGVNVLAAANRVTPT